jgi:diguanylate cyclase (GGDEF)-like protein
MGRSDGIRGRRPSLLVKFAALSLVLVSLLGFVLSAELARTIRHRSLTINEQMGGNLVDFATHLSTGGVVIGRDGPTPQQALLLKQSFDVYVQQGLVAGVDAWLTDGLHVYSDTQVFVGRRDVVPAGVSAAFIGKRFSQVIERSTDPHVVRLLGQYGRLFALYVPVQMDKNQPIIAGVVLYLRYEPMAEAIKHDTRNVFLLVALGLAALYLGLFHLVWQASRRLRRQSALNEQLATHDPLTGLPNRSLLKDRVHQALAATGRTGRCPALLLLDLDRFKEINDTLGHHHGDLLLQQVGDRLRGALRTSDTVARLGGDEFVVLLPDVPSSEAALGTAEKLLAALNQPFVLDDVTLDVEASFGLAVYPDHGDTFDSLLQHADVAMYTAKESHAGVCLYEPNQDVNSPRRLALLGELRQAIADENQLTLHYQPKVQVATGEVAGVEALLRWQHPRHGLLGPMEFIPAAERTGLIRPLTLKVLDTALTQIRRWTEAGIELNIAVNVSTRCLLDSDFPDQVERLLAAAAVPAERLELEITESTIMSDPEQAMQVLTRLADLGIALAIDDFGTGYSSLSYLKQLPVHQLKIDRSFIMDMQLGASDEAIVRSSVDLARNLGLDVVAEGVETEQTWQHLADLGCDEAQGYYFSRPMPAGDLPTWITSWRERQNVSVS